MVNGTVEKIKAQDVWQPPGAAHYYLVDNSEWLDDYFPSECQFKSRQSDFISLLIYFP